jgi:hypothetical protein
VREFHTNIDAIDICMAIAMSVNHGSLALVEIGYFYRERTKFFPSQWGLS